jgi:putative transposase
MKFRLIEVERAQHSVSLLCGVLGVTRAAFYAWKRRPTSQRELRDRELCRLIGKAFTDSRETYGAPRIRAELENGHGLRISSKRVARLMRRLGIQGVSRRGKRPVTTKRAQPAPAASDLLRRRFQAPGPDRLWVADITYVPTWKGYLFLAAVLDPSYSAGVARFLALEGIELIEVTRVARHGRRHLGKSDPRDAGAPAQAVLSGRATAQPKPRNGTVESIGCCATPAPARSNRAPRPGCSYAT